MNEVKCDSWEKFETQISLIYKILEDKRNKTPIYVSPPLFRGHARESWKLETTLQRYSNKKYSIGDYFDILCSVEPTVASLTSKSWKLSWKEISAWPSAPPGYDFMVYLRHHGFPSPLLDWSRSPYIAAFFAFQYPSDVQEDDVAIYAYVEYFGNAKAEWRNDAHIISLGPNIQTHKRHFIQQCEYTICRKLGTDHDRYENRYTYCNHEEVFQRNKEGQDILTKYLIPRKERYKVLSKLDFMNINAYSLFGNEESLMETLAYQQIERRNE